MRICKNCDWQIDDDDQSVCPNCYKRLEGASPGGVRSDGLSPERVARSGQDGGEEVERSGTSSTAHVPDRKEGVIAGTVAAITSYHSYIVEHERIFYKSDYKPSLQREHDNLKRLEKILFSLLPTGERSEGSEPTLKDLRRQARELDHRIDKAEAERVRDAELCDPPKSHQQKMQP